MATCQIQYAFVHFCLCTCDFSVWNPLPHLSWVLGPLNSSFRTEGRGLARVGWVFEPPRLRRRSFLCLSSVGTDSSVFTLKSVCNTAVWLFLGGALFLSGASPVLQRGRLCLSFRIARRGKRTGPGRSQARWKGRACPRESPQQPVRMEPSAETGSPLAFCVRGSVCRLHKGQTHPLPILANEVLLEHSPAHWFTNYPWLCSC